MSPLTFRRLSRLAVISIAAATLATTTFVTPAHAAGSAIGTVDIPNADRHWIHGRTGPSSKAFRAVHRYQDQKKIKILCQTRGQEVKGVKGTSTWWDMTARGTFVPDAKVRTGSRDRVTDTCDHVGKPARKNPRGYPKAINWAFANLGTSAYEGYCLIFVRKSYGWMNGSGWHTAEIGGDWFASRNLLKKGVPPRGAVVWYHNSVGTGHVAISLGEGLVIGSSVNGKVGVAHYKAHESYRGWSRPNFPKAS